MSAAEYMNPTGAHSNQDASTEQPKGNEEQPADGERGLGATIIGGAAGGFAGNKLGHGSKMDTALGAIVGAVASNMIEHEVKKHNQHENDRPPQSRPPQGPSPQALPPQPYHQQPYPPQAYPTQAYPPQGYGAVPVTFPPGQQPVYAMPPNGYQGQMLLCQTPQCVHEQDACWDYNEHHHRRLGASGILDERRRIREERRELRQERHELRHEQHELRRMERLERRM